MPSEATWTLRGPNRGYWRCVAAAADRRFGLMLWQHCQWESICAPRASVSPPSSFRRFAASTTRQQSRAIGAPLPAQSLQL